MSVYPGGLDSAPLDFTDWTGGPASAPSTAVLTSAHVDLMFSALVALETALGVNPQASSASVSARIAAVEAALGKIGTGAGAVTVTGTPTAGQVPTATSGTAATWQTPAGGSSIAFTDRGAWVTATAYVVGDIITQAGLRYVCKTAHTSPGSFSGTPWVALDVDLSSTYAPLASPALTGNPTAPTPSPGDNDTSIATTAFVTAAVAAGGGGGGGAVSSVVGQTGAVTGTQILADTAVAAALAAKAPLASPALTGTPTAPTAAAGTSTTQVATTAFVGAAMLSGITVVGTPGSPITNAATPRPAGATVVYWLCAAGITPSNAVSADLIWNAS